MKVKRDNNPTPAGGDYSELHFFDDKGNPVDEKFASKGIIRECLEDGTLLQETYIDFRD
jgi:hypothetical protein